MGMKSGLTSFKSIISRESSSAVWTSPSISAVMNRRNLSIGVFLDELVIPDSCSHDLGVSLPDRYQLSIRGDYRCYSYPAEKWETAETLFCQMAQ